jgi:microcystin-dependent protein
VTQTSYPFDGQSVSEAQFSRLFSELAESGVADSADSLSLKVSADGGGMRVFVQPGFAIVRGFAYESTAVEELAIPTANTQARVDRVVLRLDPSANSIVLAVLQGTAGVPTPPALTQTVSGIYELPLAQVAVGASVGAISNGNVSDSRSFKGGEVSVWINSTRPSSARLGKLGYNATTGAWEFWTGSEWGPVVPSVPIGLIAPYGGGTVPVGWHLCDGSAHGSAALQAVIGSANTPDLRDRFVVGAGSTYAMGNTGGAASVTLTAAQSGLVGHSHTASSGTQSANHTHTTNIAPFATGNGGGHYHSVMGWEGDDNSGNDGNSVDSSDEGPGTATQIGATGPHDIDSRGGAGFHAHTIDPPATASGNESANHSHTVTVNAVAGANASASHENRPPYYALTYIIKKA